jgi:1-acyl-sn-glycerol-3-phosphate acyltransferase
LIHPAVSPWFNKQFDRYNRWFLLRRYFHYIGRIGSIHQERGRPTLYIMNHSSWWDGLLVFHAIRREESGTHYMMMDEQQLKRFRFFRKLGAFSIDKSTTKGIARALTYTQELLRQGERVWIFPQGDIQHLYQRPIRFQTGVGKILGQSPHTQVIPVTLLYQWGLHQKAEATFWIGEPLRLEWSRLTRQEITRYLEVRMEKQLDDHQSLLLAQPVGTYNGLVPIWKGSPSTSDRYDSVRNGWKKWFPFSS